MKKKKKNNRPTGGIILHNIERARFLPPKKKKKKKKSSLGLPLGVALSSITNKGMITINISVGLVPLPPFLTVNLLINNVSFCKYYEIDNLPLKNLNSVGFIHINICSLQKDFDNLQELMCLLPKILRLSV